MHTLLKVHMIFFLLVFFSVASKGHCEESTVKQNENAAIEACKSYCKTQSKYRRTDWDGDGVLEYAKSITAMYDTGKVNLISKEFAAADGSKGLAFGGYFFKVLLKQGKNAPGGEKSYLGYKDHLTVGFAILAWPAKYGETGTRCFISSSFLNVYAADLGKDTPSLVEKIDAYDPDPTVWKITE